VAHQLAIDIWAPAAHLMGLDIWPHLQPLLNADRYPVRASVITALAVVGSAAIAVLRRAANDKIPLVRMRAILALERIATPEAQEIVRSELRYEVPIPLPDEQKTLYVDRYPITNAEYQVFLEDQTEREPPGFWYQRAAPRNRRNHPVTDISWDDAHAYAEWAGKRLLTRHEWKHAAGHGSGNVYPWGNECDPLRCNTVETQPGETTPVQYFSPAGDSPYGVADMAGNVWEWLADAAGPAESHRHLAGGAWMYSMDYARIDFDQWWRPRTYRHPTIGFRLCFESTMNREEK
jgi:hypothetical protein